MVRFGYILVSGFLAGLLVVIVVLGIVEIVEIAERTGYETGTESTSR